MIKLFALVLLAVSVMPSPAVSAASQHERVRNSGPDAREGTEKFYESNAKYRHHYRHRAKHRSIVYAPDRSKPAAVRVASANLEPFDWKEPVAFQEIDISANLVPMRDVSFPKDLVFKGKAPVIPEQELGSITYQPRPLSLLDKTAYLAMAVGLSVLLLSIQDELRRIRTCHKRRGLPLFTSSNWLRWVRFRVRGNLSDLSKLLYPTIRV